MAGLRLSTKARYGLKCCFLLALEDKNPITIAELSRRTDLSDKYLEQLFALLKRAGLVSATRGRDGGYILTRQAKDITVWDILSALEKDLKLSDCDSGCTDSYCPNRQIFSRLQSGIDQVLHSTTLQTMIDDYRCK